MRLGLLFALVVGIVCATPAVHATTPLQDAVSNATSGRSGSIGVVVQDLSSGELVSVNAEHPFTSASLYKLFVMEAAEAAIDDGSLDPAEVLTLSAGTAAADPYTDLQVGTRISVDCALQTMIEMSGNSAADLLLRRLGTSSVNARIAANGLSHTAITADSAVTSPSDAASLLGDIARGAAVSGPASQRMLDLLLAQQHNDRIPVPLPLGVRVAHKTGELPNLRHDAAIVFAPSGPYVLVVMVEDATSAADARATIVDVSAAVFAAQDASRGPATGIADSLPRPAADSLPPHSADSPPPPAADSPPPPIADPLPPGSADSPPPHMANSLPPRIAEQAWRVPDGQGRLALLGDPRTETAPVPDTILTAADDPSEPLRLRPELFPDLAALQRAAAAAGAPFWLRSGFVQPTDAEAAYAVPTEWHLPCAVEQPARVADRPIDPTDAAAAHARQAWLGTVFSITDGSSSMTNGSSSVTEGSSSITNPSASVIDGSASAAGAAERSSGVANLGNRSADAAGTADSSVHGLGDDSSRASGQADPSPEAPSAADDRASPTWRWLLQHAAEYGFVPALPESPAAESFVPPTHEPWTLRWVGRQMASQLTPLDAPDYPRRALSVLGRAEAALVAQDPALPQPSSYGFPLTSVASPGSGSAPTAGSQSGASASQSGAGSPSSAGSPSGPGSPSGGPAPGACWTIATTSSRGCPSRWYFLGLPLS